MRQGTHIAYLFPWSESRVVSCNCKELNLQVASSLLRNANSNLTSCKFILRVGSKITSFKLLLASYKFEDKNLWVTSCVLWVENSKMLFYEVPVALYELKV